MLVSWILFGARHVPGLQWTGKHRRIRKVTQHMRRNAKKRQLSTQKVLHVISRPYLTASQEVGSGIGKELRWRIFRDKVEEQKKLKWLQKEDRKKLLYETQLDQQFKY